MIDGLLERRGGRCGVLELGVDGGLALGRARGGGGERLLREKDVAICA